MRSVGFLVVTFVALFCTRDVEGQRGQVDQLKQYEALKTFFLATGGPTWKNNTLWLDGPPCGPDMHRIGNQPWHGVICSINGAVTNLNLINVCTESAAFSYLGKVVFQDVDKYCSSFLYSFVYSLLSPSPLEWIEGHTSRRIVYRRPLHRAHQHWPKPNFRNDTKSNMLGAMVIDLRGPVEPRTWW